MSRLLAPERIEVVETALLEELGTIIVRKRGELFVFESGCAVGSPNDRVQEVEQSERDKRGRLLGVGSRLWVAGVKRDIHAGNKQWHDDAGQGKDANTGPGDPAASSISGMKAKGGKGDKVAPCVDTERNEQQDNKVEVRNGTQARAERERKNS